MFGLCQLFASFDEYETLNKAMKESKDDVFVLQKGYTSKGFFDTIETDGLVEVENSDIQKFYDLGYKGNIYKLYNYGIAQAHQGFMLEGCLNANNKTLYKTPYAIENRGVLVCAQITSHDIWLVIQFASACFHLFFGFLADVGVVLQRTTDGGNRDA